MPPGGKYYGCRLCYDLTYESAQEAHKFDRFYDALARDTGMSPSAVKRILDRGDRSKPNNQADRLMDRLASIL